MIKIYPQKLKKGYKVVTKRLQFKCEKVGRENLEGNRQ